MTKAGTKSDSASNVEWDVLRQQEGSVIKCPLCGFNSLN